jgi:uncharacterized protein (TIGR01777 family)
VGGIVRVAITGSSGFIGSALRRSLAADGHEVLRVVRRGDGPGTTQWDIDAGRIDPAAFEGLDAVVHLAGEGIAERRWSDEQKARILDSRVRGTTLLAQTLAGVRDRPPVLLSGSGVDAYGDGGDTVLTEASPRGEGFLAEVVEAWEDATAPAEAAGIRVAHLRTAMVLDDGGGAFPRMLRIARFGLLGKLGSGRQWMSWISLDDHVRAMRFLIEGDLAGPVNVSAPNPVTNADFTDTLGGVLHRPTFVPVPSFGPKLLLGGELAETLLYESKRVLPEKLERAGFEWRHPELRGALEAILA